MLASPTCGLIMVMLLLKVSTCDVVPRPLQCRDSSLTVESFLSAVPDGLSESERAALSVCLQSEIECLQKTGITGTKKHRFVILPYRYHIAVDF